MKWSESAEGLKTKLVFKNQTELADFVRMLARHSDAIGHHADMEIRYNVLSITLRTHDAGNQVTEKDYQLKSSIEALLSKRTE